jgi:hypothetical protein
VLLWVLWGLLLALWTAALLRPEPPKVSEAILPMEWRFWAAKGLHVSAYAFLACTGGWLAPTWRARWCLWAALLAHAALTEVGQLYVPGRSGSVVDVGINATGLTLGALAGLALLRWRREEKRFSPAGTTNNTNQTNQHE